MKISIAGDNFVAATAYWERERVKQAPDRSWDPQEKVWLLPKNAANANWLSTECSKDELEPSVAKAIEECKKELSVSNERFPSWFKFKTQPMDHQMEALNAAYGRAEFGLFMEMGTGKSWCAIQLASAYYIEKKIEMAIVVAPTGVKPVWTIEFQKHATIPIDPFTLESGMYKELHKWGLKERTHTDPMPVLVVGIEALSQGKAADEVMMLVRSYKTITILDESSRIKNWKSIRTEKCWDIGGESEFRLIMTGTPITQGIPDLFGQFSFLNWQIIGKKNFYTFRNRYCVMGGFQAKQIVGYQNVGELLDLVKPFVYVCRKDDVLDLPPKLPTQRRVIPPSPAQKKVLNQLKTEYETTINDHYIETKTMLERMTRYQQICGGFYPVPVDGGDPDDPDTKWTTEPMPGKNPKVEELIEILDEVDGKVIIWARYVQEIELILDTLYGKFGPEVAVHYYGKTSPDDRRKHTELFQDPGSEVRFMVSNQSVGGMGVTWTAATTVIYFSNTFSYEDRVQSEDRAHRKGQEHPVSYVDIYIDMPMDLMIKDAQEKKKSLAQYVNDHLRG